MAAIKAHFTIKKTFAAQILAGTKYQEGRRSSDTAARKLNPGDLCSFHWYRSEHVCCRVVSINFWPVRDACRMCPGLLPEVPTVDERIAARPNVSLIYYPLWTTSRRIHGVKPPEQLLDFIEFMSGRPPVGLDPSGFYCLLFWILVDPLGLLEWNKFQRGSTKSGHPPIMTLACVFLQACPPPDFIWFQSWMTV